MNNTTKSGFTASSVAGTMRRKENLENRNGKQMKAVILFDNSKLSELSLQEACWNAYQNQQLNRSENDLNKVLLLTFNCLSNTTHSQATRYSQQTLMLLQTGLEQLECCGAFEQIEGEVISCQLADLTACLSARLREWQADVVYLAQAEPANPAPKSETSRRRQWFGAKHQSQPALPDQLAGNFTCAEIEIRDLLKQSGCPLVLTTTEGLTLKFSYHPPLKKELASSKVFV